MSNSKVYPSQIATKSIACRIPFEKWTEINSECVEKGIKINDWLLSKLFPNNNSIGSNTSTTDINTDLSQKEKICLNRQDFYEYIIDEHFDGEEVSFNEVINHNIAHRLWSKVISKDKKENYSVYDIIRWIEWLLGVIEAQKYDHASPTDIMAQTIVMLPYTKWSIKEQNDYRKEMKKLCDELEKAIEENDDHNWNVDNLLYNKLNGEKLR
jgi:hypothetical protein